jgi:hypothetical protein
MKPLYKTTIVIWTEYDTDNPDVFPYGMTLLDLAQRATEGNAYCSKKDSC